MGQVSRRNKIKKLEKQRSLLLGELQGIHNMIRGTYGEAYRRCGKPYCWCAQADKGHPYHRITWTKNARSGSQIIPKEDIIWIKKMTANYKSFRTLRTELRRQEQDLKILLDELEDELISLTKKHKEYL